MAQTSSSYTPPGVKQLQPFKYIKDEILLYVCKAICSDVKYWYKMSSEIGYIIICVFEQFANLNFTLYSCNEKGERRPIM
jgi:hypothetical protein